MDDETMCMPDGGSKPTMILLRLALWAEERKRLTEAIRELGRETADTLFLRKKRNQLDEELLEWLRGLGGQERERKRTSLTTSGLTTTSMTVEHPEAAVDTDAAEGLAKPHAAAEGEAAGQA
jgi:hypothetical protein